MHEHVKSAIRNAHSEAKEHLHFAAAAAEKAKRRAEDADRALRGAEECLASLAAAMAEHGIEEAPLTLGVPAAGDNPHTSVAPAIG